ncbi:transcriptional regulator AraC family [Vibrio maritimus]|uniref:Transcriptional regulator AraC family n=1 Tax=Vibrio maritimus TaxID=990268 RepID=A0A090RZC2_9VIBR|nr:transcriptional regulator AraC family [Vibrio maritimus]
MVAKRKPIHLNRVEKVVEYIHQNLDKTLSVTDLADISCWSRWQLQRVFQEQTNHNLAQYVREQKLSRAAERLLSSDIKITDLALEFGFNSEASFSRAFKQQFQVSPRQYRLDGTLTGIRLPLTMSPELPLEQAATQVVRIEHQHARQYWGIYGPIDTIHAVNPEFSEQVKAIWGRFTQAVLSQQVPPCDYYFGIIDTLHVLPNAQVVYWAASDNPQFADKPDLELLKVPEQSYAVISHKGPASSFPTTLEWVLNNWLPQSGYVGREGFELERYPREYELHSSDAQMEYWLPVEKANSD